MLDERYRFTCGTGARRGGHCGDEWRPDAFATLARGFSARLFEEGVFASAICYPMVPKGTARVRVITSASFSKEDCDKGLAAFAKVKGELM